LDEKIGYLRDYLRNRLRVNRLASDHREGVRVKASNAKSKPEAIPEHNDPYRIDWTEVKGKNYIVGVDVSFRAQRENQLTYRLCAYLITLGIRYDIQS
jgi:hypothetical protein